MFRDALGISASGRHQCHDPRACRFGLFIRERSLDLPRTDFSVSHEAKRDHRVFPAAFQDVKVERVSLGQRAHFRLAGCANGGDWRVICHGKLPSEWLVDAEKLLGGPLFDTRDPPFVTCERKKKGL
jgi:hypothetical protein